MSNETNTTTTKEATKLPRFTEISGFVTKEGSEVFITRNEIKDFKLDKLAILRGVDKGKFYYGIALTDDKGNAIADYQTRCKFIGDNIAAAYLETSINTKLQAFNENALASAKLNNKNWKEMSLEAQAEAFEKELIDIVSKWSMREDSQNSIIALMKICKDKMDALPKEKKVSGNEEFDAIQKEMIELSQRMLGI